MIWAPMAASLSVKYMRDSNIFSCTRTVPVHCVAVTTAMDVRSAGNAGQGPSSILGTAPKASLATRHSRSP